MGCVRKQILHTVTECGRSDEILVSSYTVSGRAARLLRPCLMYHSLIRHLLNILLIPFGTLPSPLLSVLHHEQESCALCHACKCREDESILQPHVRHPRSHTIPDGETHGVADNDDSHHGFAGQILIAVNAVRDGKLEANGVGQRNDAHGEDAAEPVDAMGSA